MASLEPEAEHQLRLSRFSHHSIKNGSCTQVRRPSLLGWRISQSSSYHRAMYEAPSWRLPTELIDAPDLDYVCPVRFPTGPSPSPRSLTTSPSSLPKCSQRSTPPSSLSCKKDTPPKSSLFSANRSNPGTPRQLWFMKLLQQFFAFRPVNSMTIVLRCLSVRRKTLTSTSSLRPEMRRMSGWRDWR